MKFEKRLGRQAFAPWKNHYISYRELKQALKTAVLAGDYESGKYQIVMRLCHNGKYFRTELVSPST
jgi:SPX domain protein involved in polyphosphate accumulation